MAGPGAVGRGRTPPEAVIRRRRHVRGSAVRIAHRGLVTGGVVPVGGHPTGRVSECQQPASRVVLPGDRVGAGIGPGGPPPLVVVAIGGLVGGPVDDVRDGVVSVVIGLQRRGVRPVRHGLPVGEVIGVGRRPVVGVRGRGPVAVGVVGRGADVTERVGGFDRVVPGVVTVGGAALGRRGAAGDDASGHADRRDNRGAQAAGGVVAVFGGVAFGVLRAGEVTESVIGVRRRVPTRVHRAGDVIGMRGVVVVEARGADHGRGRITVGNFSGLVDLLQGDAGRQLVRGRAVVGTGAGGDVPGLFVAVAGLRPGRVDRRDEVVPVVVGAGGGEPARITGGDLIAMIVVAEGLEVPVRVGDRGDPEADRVVSVAPGPGIGRPGATGLRDQQTAGVGVHGLVTGRVGDLGLPGYEIRRRVRAVGERGGVAKLVGLGGDPLGGVIGHADDRGRGGGAAVGDRFTHGIQQMRGGVGVLAPVVVPH